MMEHIDSMDRLGIYIFLSINYFIVLICLFQLWRTGSNVATKIIWTVVLLIPLLGFVFYGLGYSAPSVKPEEKRSEVHPYIIPQ